uniref:Uncharacterized protein n=1 Tax=Brassica oleracea TaxID=3712 RepID=A0A3P6DEC0_BRAOL|nr:unnamed protein product [Brassica oleracea]
MKEKPSHHPKRESRALQIRFGGTEERSTRYDQLHQRFTVETEGIKERARYHWKYLDARFSDNLSDHQIDFAFTTSLEMKLLSLRKLCSIGVHLVSVDRGHIGLHYDWRDLKVNEYHIDLISENSGVAVLEPSRSIRRFLKFLQNPWQRDVRTKRRSFWWHGARETPCNSAQIVWGVGAETFVLMQLWRAGVLFVHARAKLP